MNMRIAATASLNSQNSDPILFSGPFEESIPEMARLGFTGAELHIYDSEEIDRQKLFAVLKENNMVLTSIGTGSAYERDGICLGSQDAALRKEAVRRLEGHMKTAAPSHGIVIIGLIAGRFCDCGGDEEKFIYYLKEGLKKCAGLAGRYGVKLGFEVTNRFESDFGTTIREAQRLIHEIGDSNLGLHIDTVHMNIEEMDIGAAIRQGAGDIVHVHIAETNRRHPGCGHYNFPETLRALQEIGYGGALALEICPWPDCRTAARKSLNYLRAILQAIGEAQ